VPDNPPSIEIFAAEFNGSAEGGVMLEVINTSISALVPNPNNARTHSKKQVRQIADSIKQFGFVNPVLADENGSVIAGHGRLLGASTLGMTHVPVITLRGLTDAQKRALMLADNKIAANAGWDRERLAIEIPELTKQLEIEGLDISLTGFEIPEIDQLMVDFEEDNSDPADHFEEPSGAPISQTGDLWILGQHRLLCGNARSKEHLDRLMGGEMAAMAFLDPPYNVAVSSIVGRGKAKHREFIEATGEQTPEEFTEFLRTTLSNAARVSKAGALHYICMDWRHIGELLSAGGTIYSQHVNTAVWVKTNAGQGSFYRSQHEEILVYRVGTTAHINNVELGRHGRSRSNVWTGYAGVNTFRKGRMDDLRAHPTVKPVALVSDAMRDCTKRRDVVLDVFCGSGTTILAAERVGRRGYGIEVDPNYVDVAVRRWQTLTGKDALLSGTTSSFDEVCGARCSPTKAQAC
jgi:DNA modification methylase